MQGRESDYVILCISRYLPAEQFDAKTFAFVMDESRATVALSRAKEALIVNGKSFSYELWLPLGTFVLLRCQVSPQQTSKYLIGSFPFAPFPLGNLTLQASSTTQAPSLRRLYIAQSFTTGFHRLT